MSLATSASALFLLKLLILEYGLMTFNSGCKHSMQISSISPHLWTTVLCLNPLPFRTWTFGNPWHAPVMAFSGAWKELNIQRKPLSRVPGPGANSKQCIQNKGLLTLSSCSAGNHCPGLFYLSCFKFLKSWVYPAPTDRSTQGLR